MMNDFNFDELLTALDNVSLAGNKAVGSIARNIHQ